MNAERAIIALAVGLFLGAATAEPVAAAGAASAAPAAKRSGPVAVMPFKNLAGDAEHDWLSHGIADTMVSDLRRAKVAVVERDQIERALAEILVQGAAAAEESTAARAGRLVGARTVVVGGFQLAGKQLRINARFVDVETGVVGGAAKATGPAADPFRVQDEVVAKLLGRAPPPRPKKSPKTKTVDAYRLYAQAGTVATDAERAPLLKAALEIDPGFTYAKEDLAALEHRLAALERARDRGAIEREASLRKLVFDASAKKDARGTAANELLYSMLYGRRFHRLAADAGRLSGTDLTLPGGYPIGELADYCVYYANSRLRKLDAALQAGEQFLQRHPRSNFVPSVQVMVNVDLEEKKARERARAEGMKALAPLVEKADGLANTDGPGDMRLAGAEYGVCQRALERKLYEIAVTRCAAVAARWGGDPREGARGFARRAGWNVIQARYELGQMDAARAQAAAFVEARDDLEAKTARTWIGTTFPTDSPEDAR